MRWVRSEEEIPKFEEDGEQGMSKKLENEQKHPFITHWFLTVPRVSCSS